MNETEVKDVREFLARLGASQWKTFMRTGSVDRSVVKPLISKLYVAAGLDAPAFSWLENPLQVDYAASLLFYNPGSHWREKDLRINHGDPGKPIVLAELQRKADRSIADALRKHLGDSYKEVSDLVWHATPHLQLRSLQAIVNATRTDQIGRIAKEFSNNMSGINRQVRLYGGRLDFQRRWSSSAGRVEWAALALIGIAVQDLALDHYRIECDRSTVQIARLYRELSRTAHAYACFERLCLLSERPQQLKCDDNRQFHCHDGPAISYDGALDIYAWHGTRVPPDAILEPVRLERIDLTSNIEVRRVLIERYGVERYLLDSGSEIIQHDEYGALYHKQIPGDEPLRMVRVSNSTPEPDGTNRTYFLRVPPEIDTARAAVAWTFGMAETEYKPAIES